jgi:hypothetical protein
MSGQYTRYPPLTGGSGGVSSINSLTGAITLVAGSGITITPSGSNITIASTGGGGSGTVTSVALTSPGVVYSVTGSPITTSGTFALNLIAQNANTVFAGPTTGSAANPSFRALVSADIPNNGANTTGTSSNITGVAAIANGGTALSTAPTNGQLLIGNGTTYILSTLTGGSGISIGNTAGAITITNNAPFFTVTAASTTTAATAGVTYLANTSGASFTITLPAPVSGAFIGVKDSTGSFQTNPITIAPHASEMIEGLAANKQLFTNWGCWSFFSDGTNWFMGF